MLNFTNVITCIDTHTGGEPLRIITSGFPSIPGNTMLEKRSYVLENYDHLRKMMMLEPRGHSGMYGCIITEPVTDDGDFGVLFTHNSGLSSMCGHGIISVSKVAIEIGKIEVKDDETKIIKIDSPAGRITAYADVKGGKVEQVRFQNVPCFVYSENVHVEVDGIGDVVGDVVYCGAFYNFVDVSQLGLEINAEHSDELVRYSVEIEKKTNEIMDFKHPNSDVNWLYGTILYTKPKRDENILNTRNVCIFAKGQIDRSPTGTGTGGRAALHYAKGDMKKDDILVNESIIGTKMKVRIIEDVKEGDYDAVITEVAGTAHISGFNQLVLDPDDPLQEGFRVSGN